jgi:hypothetical protein
VGGTEYGNFSLLYVLKMSLRNGMGGSKKAKTPFIIVFMMMDGVKKGHKYADII